MIEEPITFCDTDKPLVDAFEALPRDSKTSQYWSHEEIAGLKSRLKDYYIAVQQSRCCYCNRHQRTENHRAWDLEHIVDRAKYPWFMFTPMNLAAACPDCNIAKGTAEALKTKGRKTYPSTNSDFVIFHPHFDNFEDHIHRSGHVYVPKSPKGKKTIEVCGLLRFAVKYIDWDDGGADTRFEAELEAALNGDASTGNDPIAEIMAQLPTYDQQDSE